MVEELEKLISFRSVTSDQAAVGSLLDYVEGHLSAKGLEVNRMEHEGFKSLYASTTGAKHAKIMLQGHIDTVPGGDDFHREGDKIYGRGCYDMLFATASFITLIGNLDDPTAYDLSILLTGDEEIGGENGVGAVLKSEGYTCDICILPDAGDQLGILGVAAKGVYDLRFQVNGRSHHGSRPWEGDGAGSKMIEFLHELIQIFDMSDHNNSTCTISQLEAGSSALNQGPGVAYAGVDIRYKDADDLARIRKELGVLRKKYDVDVVFEEVGRNFALDTEAPLVQQFIKHHEKAMGAPVELTKAHGSSDARFFDDLGMPVILFRPDGGNAHGDGEWLSYSSWQKFHDVLSKYVLETAARK